MAKQTDAGKEATMELGLLALRVVVGSLFVGHGTQKLFGWFGGHGRAGTARFFESLGLQPATVMAVSAGMAEVAGGALLALGLLTPLAAALLISVMAVAIATVHWRNGPWVTEGGYEYNAVMIAVAFALAAIGAGRWSLDHAFGLADAGAGWGLAALAAGLLGAALSLAIGRLGARRGRRGGHGGAFPSGAVPVEPEPPMPSGAAAGGAAESVLGGRPAAVSMVAMRRTHVHIS